MANQRGFNVFELMLAITVAGVLISIGVPSLRDMTLRQRIAASARDLQSDIVLARQEAVTRGLPVSLCTSSNGSTCSNNGWGQRRIVFADTNANGVIDPNDEPIKYSAALTDGLTLTPAAGFLVFDATGAVAAPVVLTLCRSEFVGRQIRVKASGSAIVAETSAVCP